MSGEGNLVCKQVRAACNPPDEAIEEETMRNPEGIPIEKPEEAARCKIRGEGE